ncbi:MAG: hypothetical protein OEZ06_01615 [Myxococcales bacterium]|nr:hypothetical protein [Myxococcales bacterium]
MGLCSVMASASSPTKRAMVLVGAATTLWGMACAGSSSGQRGDPLPLPTREEAEAAAPALESRRGGSGQASASATPAERGRVSAASGPPQVAKVGDKQAPPSELPAPGPSGSVEAGEIPRPQLFAVLADGVGRFLQRVQARPHLHKGRFVGWRLIRLFDDEPRQGVLRPGDTVMRVNGQSIERPEQFKNVWDMMATSSELVLDVRRGAQVAKLRYRIVD